MIPQGYKIDERYTVDKALGDGLSGEVLLVYDNEGFKALKFLKKVQMNISREEALQNFKNEFSILKELNHPNISRILDLGFDTKLKKYYFTTEYVSGKDLDHFCQMASLEMKERLIVDVLRALNYLHARGIFHFDIKPQNILVGFDAAGEPLAKVIDFGLAGYSSSGKKVGTPNYMAPEVILGKRLDGRTDLYSLGIVIYKILTGKNPFVGQSFQEVIEKQLKLTPLPITEINPELNESWNHIVSRLLKKDPNERYAHAALVIRDLNFLSNKKFAIETQDTQLSYLPEKGTLMGRDKAWEQCTHAFDEIFEKDNLSADHLVLIEGEKGMGKTRMLSELKAYSQLKNIPVLTLAQYQERENPPENYVLMIDKPDLTLSEINAVLSSHLSKKVLVYGAVEVAPKNLSGAQVVRLSPYDMADLKLYLESVTGIHQIPREWVQEIYKRTQGNPFFVAEFVKSWLNQNLFYDESGKWDVSSIEDLKIDFSKINIPKSVEEVLKSRFEALEPEEKTLAEWMAICGKPIQEKDLVALLPKGEWHKALQNLMDRDMVEYLLFNQAYQFKNSMYQNMIESLLDKQESSHRHVALAKYFESQNREPIEQYFHKSFSHDTKEAKLALVQLHLLHLENEDYSKAIAALQRFSELTKIQFLSEDIPNLLKWGELLTLTGQYQQAQEVYLDLWQPLPGYVLTSNDSLEVVLRLIDICNKQNLLDQMEGYVKKAEELLLQTGQNKTVALVLKNYKAHLLLKKNNVEESYQLFLAARQEWRENLSDVEQPLVMNNRLFDIYSLRGLIDEATQFCLENLKVLNGSDHYYAQALNHYACGDYYFRQFLRGMPVNQTQEALIALCEEHLKACIDIAKKTSQAVLLLRAYNGLGNLYSRANLNSDLALDYYRRALSLAQKINDLEAAASASFNMASIFILQKNEEDSFSYLMYSVNTFESLESITQQAQTNLYFSYLSLADVYSKKNALAKALNAIEKAKALFENNPIIKPYEYWISIRQALVYLKQEKHKLAQESYEKACLLAQSDEERDDLKQVQSQFENIEVMTPISLVRSNPMSLSTNRLEDTPLNKLIEINQIMNSEHDIKKLLVVVLEYAIELTKAQGGAILLRAENDTLRVAEALNFLNDPQNVVSTSIANQSLLSGEIIVSGDAVKDARFDGSQSVVINELHSVLCLPIYSKKKPIGVFYLDNRLRTQAFEDSDLDLLKSFCNQVGLAIENAKLVSELKQAQDELKKDLSQKEEELNEVRVKLHEDKGEYHSGVGKPIISKSKTMHGIFKLMDKIMTTHLSIFIYGESGTGKELIAKALHNNNPHRSKGKFVPINCGAIPTHLMESELFGHKQGSFTGAIRDKKGMFEEANGGTLFLDEIGELPLDLQVKLLRVLQEGEVQRIGDTKPIHVDVRVISASHQDIQSMVAKKTFREDLYYRLCQMKINLPSLRERKEDIPELVNYFVSKYAKEHDLKKVPQVPRDFLKALMEYSWPGNIRELESLISVACALAENDQISLQSLPSHYGFSVAQSLSPHELSQLNTSMQGFKTHHDSNHNPGQHFSKHSLDAHNLYQPDLSWYDYEALIIAHALVMAQFKKKVVAEWLGLSHSTVYKKIDDYGLDDKNNPIYLNEFVYKPATPLKDYVAKVFEASLKHHDGHPYAAIKALKVSQGYFYKIIRDKKVENQDHVR